MPEVGPESHSSTSAAKGEEAALHFACFSPFSSGHKIA
ncbi:hypothetical protein KNP414_02842 [Paenibacillus mucilaginosus KNP414]|uniref:Uncharacterized protein n=1 Tax=Paenibacillus mucilaginosus (strain KNP414) TaxID=1036673 RepID=F8FCY4_PAEMK|nr:hypothetical protein KNP414_02842 [Paenibacillus mucilaginosus KNP414]